MKKNKKETIKDLNKLVTGIVKYVEETDSKQKTKEIVTKNFSEDLSKVKNYDQKQ